MLIIYCSWKEFEVTKFALENRLKTFLLEGFFCHTHNAAWHTLHNIICGSADKIEGYLDAVRDHLRCSVTVIHGRNDEVLPVGCSIEVKNKIPRANIKIIEKKDHITVIVGRQKAFARELEEIWNNAKRGWWKRGGNQVKIKVNKKKNVGRKNNW